MRWERRRGSGSTRRRRRSDRGCRASVPSSSSPRAKDCLPGRRSGGARARETADGALLRGHALVAVARGGRGGGAPVPDGVRVLDGGTLLLRRGDAGRAREHVALFPPAFLRPRRDASLPEPTSGGRPRLLGRPSAAASSRQARWRRRPRARAFAMVARARCRAYPCSEHARTRPGAVGAAAIPRSRRLRRRALRCARARMAWWRVSSMRVGLNRRDGCGTASFPL